MKFRITRVLILFLFVIWIGGMLYFFSSGNTTTIIMSSSERERLVELGKLSHEKGKRKLSVKVHGNSNNRNFGQKHHPKFADRDEHTDNRILEDFNWRAYIKAAGLKPGEDKNQRNAYNQEASDKLDWARTIPDVRASQYVFLLLFIAIQYIIIIMGMKSVHKVKCYQ